MESEQVAIAIARSSDMGDFDPSDVQAALLASVQASAASKLHVRGECLQRGESSVGSEASCASTRDSASIPGSVERPRRQSRLLLLGSRSMPIDVDGVGGGQVRCARSLGKRPAIDLEEDSDEEEAATFRGGAGGVDFSGNAKDSVAGGGSRHAKGDINSSRAEVEGSTALDHSCAAISLEQMRVEVDAVILRQSAVRLRAREQLDRLDEAQLRAAHGILVVKPPVVIVGGAAGTGKSALLELMAMCEPGMVVATPTNGARRAAQGVIDKALPRRSYLPEVEVGTTHTRFGVGFGGG